MMNPQTITIELAFRNQNFDVMIPTAVTINRLKILLREALVLKEIHLPEQFDLVLRNKPFSLAPSALISEYPIGNGDQFEIVTSVE